MNKPVVLTIAGSDPTGGAGIQADLKTFAAHGVHGASVVSVLTAQNAKRFELFAVPPTFLSTQIEAVFEAFDIKAIKIGMLGNSAAVTCVIEELWRFNSQREIPVVLDPVLKASNGGGELEEEGVDLLRSQLLPLCTLVKPNLYEAAMLLNEPEAETKEQMSEQAQRLGRRYQLSVLLSGGHLSGSDALDILFYQPDGEIHSLSQKKQEKRQVHGTGCTLTSAIAANLAKGLDLPQATEQAKDWLSKLMEENKQIDQSDQIVSLGHSRA